MEEYEGKHIWRAVLLKNKTPSCQKKVFNASLTELTHSFLVHGSPVKALSGVQAVGGQLAHRNVSVMPYIAEPTWFGVVNESRPWETRWSRVQAWRWRQTCTCSPGCCRTEWITFQLKTGISNRRCRSTYDAGRKISQTQIEASLLMVHASSWDFFFFYIKVAFFNQFLHIQLQTSRQPHVAFPPCKISFYFRV